MARVSGSDGSCRHCPEPAMAKGQRATASRDVGHLIESRRLFGLPVLLFVLLPVYGCNAPFLLPQRMLPVPVKSRGM
jgi:hypothetical protein